MTTSTGQQLPHYPEAEQQILGAVLLDAECWPTVASTVGVKDFYREPHRLVFQALHDLAEEGAPFDLTSLVRKLNDHGKIKEAGGAVYLAELVGNCTSSANVKHYLGKVRESSLTRQLHRALGTVAHAILTPGKTLDELMEAAYLALDQVAGAKSGGVEAVLSLTDMARIYSDHVSQLDKNRFMTGFEPLDAVIKGISPGETLFIAAYSGLGKSALLHNIFLDSCRRTGNYHLLFSMEMQATRCFERTVQIALQRPTYHIESEFHHHNPEKRAATMLELGSANADKLLVCEQGGLTLEAVEHYTRMARSRYGKISAIGLDYLGLMSAPNTRGEYERISAVAEGAKHLAKRLNLPVVVLAQISREAAKGGAVEMHSAKGSGAVEASADYMLALEKKDGHILLKLLKNRNGEADISYKVNIRWPFLRFDSLEPWDDKALKEVQRGKNRRSTTRDWQSDEEDPYP
jgi:replicative DNA helicase